MTEREISEVRQFIRMLLRSAPLREDAADIEQEVLIKVWQRWDSLTHWEQYVRQCVVTAAIDHIADAGKMVPLVHPASTEDIDAADLLISWQSFRDGLSSRDQIIWEAAFLGVEDDDLASILNMQAKRVRYILGRLRAKFREYVQGPREP